MTRHRYRLDLASAGPFDGEIPQAVSLRIPNPEDLPDLAQLMLEAYRGTIDYEGEGIDEAIAEVESYFAGSPLLNASVVVTVDGEMASACLVAESEDGPLVGYVMTAPPFKGTGLGTLATRRSVAGLQASGLPFVEAYITEGNVPSEGIFRGLGFEIVAT